MIKIFKIILLFLIMSKFSEVYMTLILSKLVRGEILVFTESLSKNRERKIIFYQIDFSDDCGGYLRTDGLTKTLLESNDLIQAIREDSTTFPEFVLI